MKMIVMVFAVLVFLPLASKSFAAESSAVNGFERQMFAPIVLGAFGADQQKIAALSRQEKQSALSARRVLIQFLRIAQTHTPDVKQLVDSGLLARFANQSEMLDKLFGQETEVLIAAVTDIQAIKKGEVELAYCVVLFSEGRMLIREDRALLRQKGRRWVISRIGGIQ